MKHEMNYNIMYKHPDYPKEEIDQAKDISEGNYLVCVYYAYAIYIKGEKIA